MVSGQAQRGSPSLGGNLRDLLVCAVLDSLPASLNFGRGGTVVPTYRGWTLSIRGRGRLGPPEFDLARRFPCTQSSRRSSSHVASGFRANVFLTPHIYLQERMQPCEYLLQLSEQQMLVCRAIRAVAAAKMETCEPIRCSTKKTQNKEAILSIKVLCCFLTSIL